MGMAEMVQRWTREMVLALPDDGKRYELFDGDLLVTPAPAGPHQVAAMRLFEFIAPYVRAQKLGVMLWSPADLSLGGDQLSQPDLFVMPYLPKGLAWPDFPDPARTLINTWSSHLDSHPITYAVGIDPLIALRSE